MSHYILVDYENCSPVISDAAPAPSSRVIVFVGHHQKRIEVFGCRGEYIRISGKGPNALDFHIAYYIGEIHGRDAGATFSIYSNDKGYDPLIAHLKEKGISVDRLKTAPSPKVRSAAKVKKKPATVPTQMIDVVATLSGMTRSKPATVKALTNCLCNSVKGANKSQQAASLVRRLTERGYISISGKSVTYNLPT